MIEDVKNKARQLVTDNEFDECFKLLTPYFTGDSTLFVVQGNWNKLNETEIKGTEGHEVITTERNKIRDSLLKLIQTLNDSLDQDEPNINFKAFETEIDFEKKIPFDRNRKRKVIDLFVVPDLMSSKSNRISLNGDSCEIGEDIILEFEPINLALIMGGTKQGKSSLLAYIAQKCGVNSCLDFKLLDKEQIHRLIATFQDFSAQQKWIFIDNLHAIEEEVGTDLFRNFIDKVSKTCKINKQLRVLAFTNPITPHFAGWKIFRICSLTEDQQKNLIDKAAPDHADELKSMVKDNLIFKIPELVLYASCIHSDIDSLFTQFKEIIEDEEIKRQFERVAFQLSLERLNQVSLETLNDFCKLKKIDAYSFLLNEKGNLEFGENLQYLLSKNYLQKEVIPPCTKDDGTVDKKKLEKVIWSIIMLLDQTPSLSKSVKEVLLKTEYLHLRQDIADIFADFVKKEYVYKPFNGVFLHEEVLIKNPSNFIPSALGFVMFWEILFQFRNIEIAKRITEKMIGLLRLASTYIKQRDQSLPKLSCFSKIDYADVEDLSHLNLLEFEFSGDKLKNLNFRFSNLRNSSFQFEKYWGVDFYGCHLVDAKFRGRSEMKDWEAEYQDETGLSSIHTTFSWANMENVVFDKIEFSNVSFERANLFKAYFIGVVFEKCEFRYSDLQYISFSKTSISNCSFEYANLANTDFSGIRVHNDSDQNETSFAWARLFRANFENSTFIGVNFSNVDLTTCKLEGAKFKECNFQHCRFGGSLKNVDFSDSDLENADFYNAKDYSLEQVRQTKKESWKKIRGLVPEIEKEMNTE